VGGAHSGMARELAFCRGFRDERGLQGVDAPLGVVATAASGQVAVADDTEFDGKLRPRAA